MNPEKSLDAAACDRDRPVLLRMERGAEKERDDSENESFHGDGSLLENSMIDADCDIQPGINLIPRADESPRGR
jgi:hypothetical protein